MDVAINHDIAAIAMHDANHPTTSHHCENVWSVDPRTVYPEKRIGLAWFSPDCTHHSKARGGKPREKKIRGLAWVALRWAAIRRPRVIILENVEEFVTWGPLDKDGQPIEKQKGRTFQTFVNALRYQGYEVEWRELRACDYGAPTIRKRFFLIARCDGQQIVWPKPTYGAPESLEVQAGRLKPWRTAEECIDWSIPVPSIFGRKKELAENTKYRIAKGIMKFIVNNPKPFVIKVNHSSDDTFRGQKIDEPLQTITAKNGWGIVVPFLAKYNTETTAKGVRGQALDQPLLTQDTSNRFGLVSANIIKFHGKNIGQLVDEPLHTVTAGGNHHGLVYAFLTTYYGASIGQSLDSPLCTIPTHDRFGLVLIKIDGIYYEIVDIGMRMLEPHELYAAQGFPRNYIISGYNVNGRQVSKAAQVARCGNSVPPAFAKALVQSNLPEHCIGSKNKITFNRYTEQVGQLQLSI